MLELLVLWKEHGFEVTKGAKGLFQVLIICLMPSRKRAALEKHRCFMIINSGFMTLYNYCKHPCLKGNHTKDVLDPINLYGLLESWKQWVFIDFPRRCSSFSTDQPMICCNYIYRCDLKKKTHPSSDWFKNVHIKTRRCPSQGQPH